jgi:hypothetical protein
MIGRPPLSVPRSQEEMMTDGEKAKPIPGLYVRRSSGRPCRSCKKAAVPFGAARRPTCTLTTATGLAECEGCCVGSTIQP